MRQAALPMDGLPANVLLEDRHYLGPSHRAKFTFEDERGVMVFAAPSSRNLPKSKPVNMTGPKILVDEAQALLRGHIDPDCEVVRGVGWMCTCETPEQKAENSNAE
jgi:hypothetical protein